MKLADTLHRDYSKSEEALLFFDPLHYTEAFTTVSHINKFLIRFIGSDSVIRMG